LIRQFAEVRIFSIDSVRAKYTLISRSPNWRESAVEIDMAKSKEPSTHHVLPNSDREVSRNAKTEFKIHNQDCRISHGNDPRKITG